jgi:hypothetical protein
MKRPSLAERAAAALAKAPVGADAGEASPATIAAMQVALRRRKHQRLQRRIGIVVGGVALAASVALAITRPWAHPAQPVVVVTAPAAAIAASVTGEVLHVTKAGSSPLTVGSRIEVSDRVVALKDARAEVRLPSGTQLSLENGADLTVLGQAPMQVFTLTAGAVQAKVTKLAENERFIIRTTDAEIEVRGTSFRLAFAAPDPLCGKGTVTRVSVDEGIVAVRAFGDESLVNAGEDWPTCLAPAPAEAASSAAPPAPSFKPPAPKPVSDLAAQNDLFDRAMTAKRAGDRNAALKLLNQLLTKYPSSPLAEQARSEREKMLR